jgi:hypothetical protein
MKRHLPTELREGTSMKQKFALLAVVFLMVGVVALPSLSSSKAAEATGKYLADVQTGNPGLKSVGVINFGPQGILLVADTNAAAIVAIDTGDTGPVAKLKQRIEDIYPLAAAVLGTANDGLQINDMAVNPASGKVYLSVTRKQDKQPAILVVDADGKVKDLDLNKAKYVRVVLPGEGPSKVRNITDVEFAGNRLVVAGQSGEEFSSKIHSLPLPLKGGVPGTVFSTNTYHVAHGKWETKAPISQFVPLEDNGKQYVVGSFACTPLVKYELDDVNSGSQVKGTSVVELGNGNRPRDMFVYEKNGKKWLVTTTLRMGNRGLFGPSKYWAARVSMDYMNAAEINEKAARRDTNAKSGPEGIEIVDALFGAVEVDKLGNDEAVVLRADKATDSDSKLSLEVVTLP